MKAVAPLLGHLLCRRIPRAKRAAQAVATGVPMAGGYDGGMAAGRRVRRRLCPRRRAVDRAAMRTNGNCVGKLALCRKVAGDVCIVCRRPLKMFGDSFSWVEYKHGFPKFAAECENSSCLIGVSGYQREAVSVGMHGVDKGCDRKIYVGSFFFKFHDTSHTGMGFFTNFAFPIDMGKPCLLLAVKPFDDLHPAKCGECLDIYLLTFFGGYVLWICADARREILNGEDIVFLLEHGGSKRAKVEPFTSWRVLQQAVVKIVSVYVNKCLFHVCQKMQGASTFRLKPPRRIGRASRVEYNPLTSSVGIVPNLHAVRKGSKFANWRIETRKAG